ncbi:hypothetical protein [Acinetobacter bohemicus]|uniref:hypothetical protein n=1 Tax=Acinetobacter bohemicus TaxID=1435036 RepID=UPI00404324A2
MQINIFKTYVLALAVSALTACSKPNEKTVESVPVSSAVPEAIEIPVSEPISEKSKNEEGANQALDEYKKDKQAKKYKKYADAVIYAIDENQSLDYEINSAAEVDGLFQVTEIENLKFLKGSDHTATYNVKVGVIRGGHITSECNVTATYDDSIGQIDWKIPSECHDF